MPYQRESSGMLAGTLGLDMIPRLMSPRLISPKTDLLGRRAGGFSSWSELLEVSGIPSAARIGYGLLFAKEELPPPGADSKTYMCNEFLQSMGVARAGHRARILKLVNLLPADDLAVMESGFVMRSRSSSNNEAEPAAIIDLLPETEVKKFIFTSESEPPFTWYELVGKDGPEDDDHTEFYGNLQSMIDDMDLSISLMSLLEQEKIMPIMVKRRQNKGQCAIVFRVACPSPCATDDSIGDLTNRWTVFVDFDTRMMASVHRVDTQSFASLRQRWATRWAHTSMEDLVAEIFENSLQQFCMAIDATELLLENGNEDLMSTIEVGKSNGRRPPSDKAMLALFFHIQRRAAVYSRIVHLTRSMMEETAEQLPQLARERFFQLKMSAMLNELQHRSEKLTSDAQSLLSLHLALASFRSNELMNVLTKMSSMFIPMTFVAGIYGMNFDVMPELLWPCGYWVALGIMVSLASVVLFCFWYKGIL